MQYTNGINSTVQSVYVTLVSLILTVVWAYQLQHYLVD